MVGDGIALVDTGAAVARQLQRRIQTELPARQTSAHPEPVEGRTPSAQFFTSGDPEQASRIISVLWRESVVVTSLPPEFL